MIPLVAAGNRGKTHTLNLLAKVFIEKSESQLTDTYSVERLDDNSFTEKEDNMYAFRIKTLDGFSKVVITTQGDDETHIRNAKAFVDRYWSVESRDTLFWFLASRTSGSSWNQVLDYEKQLCDSSKRYWTYKGNLWTTDISTKLSVFQKGAFSKWNQQDALRLFELFEVLVHQEELE